MTSSHLNEMYDVICVKVFLRKFLRMEKAYPVPTPLLNTQGPEKMFLSLEHQNPSKTSEIVVILIALQFRHTFYRPQTKRLRARKIGLQYKILFSTRHFVPRSPFGRRTVRQRGYGLRLLIFKMANNEVDPGQIRSEEIVYSRFIKIPLG